MSVPVAEACPPDHDVGKFYPISPATVETAPSMKELAQQFTDRTSDAVAEDSLANAARPPAPRKACQDIGACSCKWRQRGYNFRKFIRFNEVMRMTIHRLPAPLNPAARQTLELFGFDGYVEGEHCASRFGWVAWLQLCQGTAGSNERLN